MRSYLAPGRSVSGRRLVAQGQDPAAPMAFASAWNSESCLAAELATKEEIQQPPTKKSAVELYSQVFFL